MDSNWSYFLSSDTRLVCFKILILLSLALNSSQSNVTDESELFQASLSHAAWQDEPQHILIAEETEIIEEDDGEEEEEVSEDEEDNNNETYPQVPNEDEEDFLNTLGDTTQSFLEDFTNNLENAFHLAENNMEQVMEGFLDNFQQNQVIPPDEPKHIEPHYTYSSLFLTNLAQAEETIYTMFTIYEHRLLERIELIRRYREDYVTSVVEALKGYKGNKEDPWGKAAFLMLDPFLNHRMNRRFAVNIPEIRNHITQNLEANLVNNLEEWRGDYLWPSENDLQESSNILLRLREAYDTDTLDFVRGKVKETETGVGLKAVHAVELAGRAYTLRNDRSTANELLRAGKVILDEGKDTSTSIQVIRQFWEWINDTPMTSETWNIDDLPPSAHDAFGISRQEVKANYERKKFALSYGNRIENYQALCRGELPKRRIQPDYKLPYCSLQLTFPSFTFERVEFLSTEPKILLIHDLFRDGSVTEITSQIGTSILSTMTRDAIKPDGFPEAFTTGFVWVHNFQQNSEFIASLRRVESLLHLNLGKLANSIYYLDEPVLVSTWSAGGFSEPSYDPEPVAEGIPSGRRIATVHFILEDPQAGGELAFTRLGLTAKPQPGSAIILFSNNDKGEPDERLLRGTCPVILGNKWVATSFYRDNSNYLNLQCPLDN